MAKARSRKNPPSERRKPRSAKPKAADRQSSGAVTGADREQHWERRIQELERDRKRERRDLERAHRAELVEARRELSDARREHKLAQGAAARQMTRKLRELETEQREALRREREADESRPQYVPEAVHRRALDRIENADLRKAELAHADAYQELRAHHLQRQLEIAAEARAATQVGAEAHAEVVAQIERELADAMQSIDDLGHQHGEALEDASEREADLVDQLDYHQGEAERQRERLAALDAELQAARKRIEERERTGKAYEAQVNERASELGNAIWTAYQQHGAELANAQRATDQVRAELDAALALRATLLQQRDTEHGSELARLYGELDVASQRHAMSYQQRQELHGTELDTLRQQFQELRHELELANRKNEQLEQAHREALDHANQALAEATANLERREREHAAQLEGVVNDHAKAMTEQGAAHEKELQRADLEAAEQLRMNDEDYRAELKAQRATSKKKTAVLDKAHQRKTAQLEAAHQKITAQLEATHQKQVDKLVLGHQVELDDRKRALEQANDKLAKQAVSHEAAVAALREQLERAQQMHDKRMELAELACQRSLDKVGEFAQEALRIAERGRTQ